jgi:Kef-type K+ transport system membrane component KefB
MVIVFSLLLIVGIISGQVFDLSGIREAVSFITSVFLAYIMMEVGLEFSVEKRKLSSYGFDFIVASTAAILPALLCFIYFLNVTQSPWREALVSGLSAAPTSAGVLFAMLMAAGLASTWVFQKARVLAVLDDLVTILLLTPLQFIILGFEWQSLIVLGLISLFLFAAFKWQNTIHLPINEKWLLVYAIVLNIIISVIKHTVHVHLEVLVPAFMWGCLVRPSSHYHAPEQPKGISFDSVVKGGFMFLVGVSLPKIAFGSISLAATAGHVLALTFLSNVGKFILMFFYKTEASLKERMALGVAMFPRGEVGAAVLLIGLGYGLGGYSNTLAVLTLSLNLVLTGVFIWVVMRFLK